MLDLESPEIKSMVSESIATLKSAEFQIKNPEQYELSANVLKTIKTRIGILEDKRKEMTKPLDEAKRKIMEFFRFPIENYERAKEVISNTMIGYRQEQEKIRREKEAKEAELIKKEEEKQKKLLERQALKAEKEGDLQKAEDLRNQKQEYNLPPPIIESEIPKVDGTSIRLNYYAEVIDLEKIPREYLIPNMPMLNKMAQATKGTINIPGVIFKSREIIVSKGGN